MRKTMFAVAAVLAISTSSAVLAQSSTIWTPGQPKTFVDPSPNNGGYIVTTPGQPRTFVDRNPNGGYTVFTPGQPRTFIDPSPLNQRRSPYGN